MARSIFFYTDSDTFGGAEQAMLMLIDGLDRDRWSPTVLLEDAPGGPPLRRWFDEIDVEVRTVSPLPLGVAGAIRVPAMALMLRRRRPDVFHAHLSWPMAAKYALVSALAAGVPATVATVQLFPQFALDRSSLWQQKVISAGVGRYIAVSRDIAERLERQMRWPAAKIDVVYNAVQHDRFDDSDPRGLRARLLAGSGRQLVLTTARLDRQKGHPVLLKAALELPQASFVFAGEGPERGALEAQVAELGLADRVTFLGRREDVPELLAACDVFALPSLYEGSSLAVLEAMAARRPVVSSWIGGTSELIEDGVDGLLVVPGDAPALAAALRRLLADARLRDSLAQRGRARVEREFTAATMIERVVGIYEKLLSRG